MKRGAALVLLALLLSSFISVSPSGAVCENKTDYTPGVECAQTTVVVNNDAELDAYLSDFGFDGQSYQNLMINYDVTRSNMEIHSPCTITLKDNVDLTGDSICLDGRNGVLDSNGCTANADQVTILSELGDADISQGSAVVNANELIVQGLKKAKIGSNSIITVPGVIKVISTGDLTGSDASIGGGSHVTANSLLVQASRGATIGTNAIVDVTGNISVISTGDDTDSFAVIEQGAHITSNSLLVQASRGATIGTNAQVEVTGNMSVISTGDTTDSFAVIEQGAHINANSLLVQALRGASIGINAQVINAEANISVISTGDTTGSIAVIEQGAHITANSLLVQASRGASIGKNADIKLSGNTSVISTGNYTDSLSIIKDGASVNTDSLDMTSNKQATLEGHVHITASGNFNMQAESVGQCSIDGSASINAGSVSGNCFIEITSPADGWITNNAALTVSGIVSDSGAVVEVNGILATVVGGNFTAENVPLTEGPNTITATATTSEYSAEHSITVTLDTVAPIPNLDPLPTVTGECSATVTTTPTATDNVSGQITGITTDPLVYTDQGIYTVTWTYDDGNGNSSTQAQTVTVDDVTAPVPDIASLPDIEGEESVTVSTTPTATDNCVGAVTATTTDPLIYSTVGEYTITWTYDDGHGNISTQQQTIRVLEIGDTTPPVPDVDPLATITGECSATVTNTPTATDAVAGLITGTTIDPLIYTDQGIYTVTWTYDDGNGNSSTQTQTVTVDDVTAPVPDVDPLADIEGEGGVTVSIFPTATDNCVGAVTATTTDSLTYSTVGEHTINWTYDDGNGNTSTQTQTIRVVDTTAPVADIDPLPPVNGECSATVTNTPTATDAIAGLIAGTTTDPLFYEYQGIYTVTWTYDDGNGNSSTQAQTVTVDDVTAPVPDVDPLADIEGEGSVTIYGLPTATDYCEGTIIGTTTDSLTYSAVGEYTVTWSYDDGYGNISTQQQTARVVDTVPPALSITNPANGAQIISATPNITVTFSDDKSGINTGSFSAMLDTVDITSSFTVTATEANYQIPVSTPLADGAHTLEISISDNSGNTATQTSQFEYLDAPVVTITSPENLVTLGSSPVTVAGTVSDITAILTVNGVEVPINPDGTYSVDGIVLNEGGNTIIASAINSASNVGTANIHVYMDSTAPYITITYPEDGYTTTSSTITVTGSIFDIVKGEVNPENASVSVNGIAAVVSNKTFIAENISLVEGENIISAIGADQTGNTKTASATVYLDSTAVKKIAMVSGNNQSAPINTSLADPLVVSLTDADGSPAVGKTVIFKIIQNTGLLTGSSGQALALAETTDASGNAQVSLKLGSTAGAGNNKVEVAAVGYTGKVLFTASGQVSSPNEIHIATGNNQKGAVNTPLPQPLIAIVTDEGHNQVKDVPVTFTATRGGGNFAGQPSITVNTDSDGRATVNFTLGSVGGLDNNTVEADFPGNTNALAIFKASGLIVGDPGDTKISGVVLDNSNIPIPGVTMRVEGTTREGITDADGQFLITNVPVGPMHLIADGSTATIPGEYPTLGFEIDTVAGQDNSLPMPIYLLPLNITNTQWVGGNEDVVYTLESIPGFEMVIKANSVTFPDGSREGYISITQVHADKVPMEPPNGFQPRFIITIQPPGAVFDPPAPLTLPNVDGYPPNHITEMYSFDHDLGQFVSIGTGTVSEDGLVIKSDPGVGVIKAGWHCGGDPMKNGCCLTCAPCWSFDPDGCHCDTPNNNQTPPQIPGNCKREEYCLNGPQGSIDDSDVPYKPGNCQREYCINGTPASIADDTDIPDDECMTCVEGKPTPKVDTCCDGGASQCDGNGDCLPIVVGYCTIECNGQSDGACCAGGAGECQGGECRPTGNTDECQDCVNGTLTDKADGTRIPGEECKVCQGGVSINKADGTAIPGEECKECQGGVLTNKADGTAIPGEECKICQGGIKVNKPDDTCVGDGTEICIDGANQQVKITTVNASADKNVIKVGETVNFTGTASGNNCVYEYNWDFGDGNTSTLKNKSHNYTNPGEYNVSLKAKCKDCSPPEVDDTVKITVVDADFKSITFVSDHGILKDNFVTWDDTGSIYPEPEWQKSPYRSYSITQTKDTNVKINIKLDLLPTNLQSENFILTGTTSAPYLTFSKNGNTGGGTDKTISSIISVGNIPDNIGTVGQSITWKLVWNGMDFDLGDSTGHLIYVTYGFPSGGVTEKRVNEAIMLTKGFGNNPHDIVRGQMARFPNYVLGKSYLGNIWLLADNIAGGAECQAIVRFVQACNKMIGLPGTEEGIVVYAAPTAPDTPIVGTLGPTGGSGGMSDFPAQPITNYRAWLLDVNDNANNYEAALKFTYNSIAKYYLGGIGGESVNNTTEVLHTFAKMAWCDWDVLNNKWIPKVIIIIYP